VQRVSDEDSQILRVLSSYHIGPGSLVQVKSKQADDELAVSPTEMQSRSGSDSGDILVLSKEQAALIQVSFI